MQLDEVAYNLGQTAFSLGIRDIQAAKKNNPYRGFGVRSEHVKFVSWNKGWNQAKETFEAKITGDL